MAAFFIFIFLGLAQLILFLFYLFEFEVIKTIFMINNPTTLLVLGIVLGILSISFVLSSIIESMYNNLATRIFYRISAIWMGFLAYLLMTSIVFYVFLAILLPFGISLKIITLIGKALLALALFITIYGLWNARQLKVTHIDLKLAKLPPSWKGKKAVWVSDLQLGQIYGKDFSDKVVGMIKQLSPDILFVGGDLYDGVAIDLDESIKPFSTLQPPLGKYFITGNHEEFSDNTKYLNAVQRAGMKPLVDQSINIDGVELVGVDYATTSKKVGFKKILSELTKDKSKFYILLKHSPSNVEIADKEGVSFMISGHTHKAQMAPLNIFTRTIYGKYEYGLQKGENITVYTSSGAGTWGPPLKVGARSEIVSITFN